MCGKESGSWVGIAEAGGFAVSVLAADQGDVCATFASRSEDKFEQVHWRPSSVTGSPIIEGCVAWLDCRIETIYEGGDHHIVVGRVVDLDVHDTEARPMVFHKGAFGHFGQ
jgi:3-hydroxy-9,10-secoandrosta-1,3,5(10)-triene-9,17-dione monooxygenase reductase component